MNREDLYKIANRDLDPRHVTINHDVIARLTLPSAALGLMSAGLTGHPVSKKLENAIAYILVVNSINWMFWALDDTTETPSLIRYQHGKLTGALAMRAALKEAWGDDETPATFTRNLQEKGITGVFADIPDPQGRLACLTGCLGPVLDTVSHGLAEKVTTEGRLTIDDANAVALAMPEVFGDRYLKRAQLALAEIAGHCADMGQPVELDVTSFADYQVPRSLRGLDIITYSPELAAKVDSLQLIEAGSTEELSIRAATILACKAMAEKLGVSEAGIDNFLWQHRNALGASPFHLTVTRDY